MLADPERFNAALARFDAANAEDPTTEVFQGVVYPKELLYAQRMTAWLDKLAPDASEALRLAVRCQHIQRWRIPRHTYPMDRTGYLRWRTTLARFHADTASAIMRDLGYDDATIRRVRTLLRKESLKRDPEVQCLEDVICLVFLENYFAAFATQHNEAKIVDILQKTWKKMSSRGHEVALTLPMSPEARRLVEQALAAP
jgi:Domain of unknown function (DUF4202)